MVLISPQCGSLLLRPLSRYSTIHGRGCSAVAATASRRTTLSPPRDGKAALSLLACVPRPLLPAMLVAAKGWTTAAQRPALVSARYVTQTTSRLSSHEARDSTIKDENKPNDDKKSKERDNSKKADSGGNILLDYLGTIFLAGLGLIVVALVRSYKGGNNRNRTREIIEQVSALDPLEIEDLRLANSDLTLDVFRRIQSELMASDAAPFGSENGSDAEPKLLYSDFVRRVRTALRTLKGDEAFTVELGHYLDRVVLDVLGRRGQVSTRDPQPVAFWMTVLSLALNAPVPERILALYEIASGQQQQYQQQLAADHEGDGSDGDRSVTVEGTRKLVGYLQDTCQLTPDTQVVEDPDRKYPIQQYVRGDVGKLFVWDGPDTDELDIDAFSDILRSRAVCVWGECYHRRKVV